MNIKKYIHIVLSTMVILLYIVLFIGHEYIFSNDLHEKQINKYSIEQINKEDLKIHFINVGQADCILIEKGYNSMIIDAGNDEDSNLVFRYLKRQNIDKFDYVIGTHAHQDHIGGLDDVINSYDIDNVIFPKQVHKTNVYKSFIKAVNAKGIQLHSPNVGETFKFGKATFEIMAPNSIKYEKSNDYSIVIKLTYGDNTFLFAGDAEYVSEYEMLDNELDITADLIKIGHHGGSTSTSKDFINKVNPKYAVVTSVSNKHGYPSYKIISRLRNMGIEIYRTSEYGNIVVASDGRNITFYTNNN
ncbi:MAG: fold metallo-hydrolase [Clostridia bacterium]|jgi:competence protein ComEC|nr:fold metallo-hydrolase [Clostridia bacterium]